MILKLRDMNQRLVPRCHGWGAGWGEKRKRTGYLNGEEFLLKQGYKLKSFIFRWGQLNFQW